MAAKRFVKLKSKHTYCTVCNKKIEKNEPHSVHYGKYKKVMVRYCSYKCEKKDKQYWDEYIEDEEKDIYDKSECQECHGNKTVTNACPTCEGNPHDFYGDEDVCPDCEGLGWVDIECPDCKGSGLIKR